MFAAASENGSIQIWDTRKAEKCLNKFSAHNGPVFSCDWHSELQFLATASRDKSIKVTYLAFHLSLYLLVTNKIQFYIVIGLECYK